MKRHQLIISLLIFMSVSVMSQRVIDLDSPEEIFKSHHQLKKELMTDVESKKICRRYNTMLVGGTVLLAGGITMTIAGRIMANKNNSWDSKFTESIAVHVGGISATVGGIVLTSIGASKSKMYCGTNKIRTVYIAPSNDGLAMGIKF